MSKMKVRYKGKTWELLDIAFHSVKIRRDGQTIILLRDKVKACNKEARAVLNGLQEQEMEQDAPEDPSA